MTSVLTREASLSQQSGHLVWRPATAGDIDGLYRLALGGGAGLTNLPADRDALARRVDASIEVLRSEAARADGAAIIFVVERMGLPGEDAIVGTACIFPSVGTAWPFYSYRITRQAQSSKTLGKKVGHDVLILTNEFDGSAEVGGLFVHKSVRGAAAGRLAARSRYLFMAEHRDWFGTQVISELRGYQDETGRFPFWEALGREFYDMEFAEADYANSILGNQFIADLAPRHPIYASLLPRAAREALGRPHDDGRRAMELLIQEGFRYGGYVDIFDGGPTLAAPIDTLKAVRDSRCARIVQVSADGGMMDRLVSTGVGADFRATRGGLAIVEEDGAVMGEAMARALGVVPGDEVRYVDF